MSFEQTVFSQFRQPTGLLGLLAGLIMSNRPSNRQRNNWTIERLDVQIGDRLLELGCGPGLAVEAAVKAGATSVLALDHSQMMLNLATWRCRGLSRLNRVEFRLGGLESLRSEDAPFNAAYMVNVAQFLPDRVTAFTEIRRMLGSGGRLAITHQPRHPGARAEDAEAFAVKITDDLQAAGFGNLSQSMLHLRPVPAVCIIGCA